ncbi:SDR family NAD(P)-dependent oxidoreductase [Psychrobacter sp. S1-30-MNA-CIBAN-0213]|uniref:SDR family NAD(P)-dependent oxidoreductase n=1 Tax=unclassified Psychrobacter TaxID=196806 RepID=UPI003332E107
MSTTPYLKDTRNKQHPKLVLISSMTGLMGCYGYAGYCASKFDVVGLADVLGIDRTGQNIRHKKTTNHYDLRFFVLL